MNPKIGDIVFAKDERRSMFGEIIRAGNGYKVKNYHTERWFHKNNVTKGILNNPLNRRLYPDRTEFRGYLLPAEIAGKLNEEITNKENK